MRGQAEGFLIYRRAAAEVRGSGILFEAHEEGGEDTDSLRQFVVRRDEWCKEILRTVCDGGTLECPPGAATSIRTSKYPFSAVATVATGLPNSFM